MTATRRFIIAPMRDVLGITRKSLTGRSRRQGSADHRSLDLGWHDIAQDQPARTILNNTLRSACDLIGADRGFVVVLREETTLEVASIRGLRPRDLLDPLLGLAARSIHCALAQRQIGLGDPAGLPMPCPPPASGDIPPPTVVSLPLELGARQRGALVLLNERKPRALSALDFEILGALAGQAELALAAASQQCALSRLEARLNALPPSAG